MRGLALLLLIAAASPGFSLEPAIEDACSSEISLLCAGLGSKTLACLDEHRKVLLPVCADALSARAEARANQAAAFSSRASVEVEARLARVKGPVYVHTAAQAQDEYIPAEPGMPLAAGDLIRTGVGGSAELAWDGSSAVNLSANSDLSVRSLNKNDSEFFLGLGGLLAKLKKLAEGEVRFRTPTAVAAVRGTELAVSQDASGEQARVAVFDEGSVAVSAVFDGKTGPAVMLTQRQETQVSRGQAPASPSPLAAFAKQAREMPALRRDVAAIQHQWQPQGAEERMAAREKMAAAPSTSARGLSGVNPGQRTRNYNLPPAQGSGAQGDGPRGGRQEASPQSGERQRGSPGGSPRESELQRRSRSGGSQGGEMQQPQGGGGTRQPQEGGGTQRPKEGPERQSPQGGSQPGPQMGYPRGPQGGGPRR